jgi:hypothetical protein
VEVVLLVLDQLEELEELESQDKDLLVEMDQAV